MPIYEFECTHCGTRSEHLMRLSDPDPTECPGCNAPLHAVAKAQVEHRLPPHVRELYHRFSTCEVCGRVFWEGAHWQRMAQFDVDRGGRLSAPSYR